MTDLPRPSKAPCGTCPYRLDIEPGIWAQHEYEKLPAYDGDTVEQVMKGAFQLFMCHQNDGHLCAGWVGCHDTQHLLALRMNPVHPSTYGYVSPIALFATGAEAAAHGMSGIDNPSRAAQIKITKLERKLKKGKRK